MPTPPKPPSSPLHSLRPAALLGLAVLGAVAPAPAQAKLHPQRQALMARVDAVREKLDSAAPAAATGPTLTAQATNWTNWPKWSKWSNWANK